MEKWKKVEFLFFLLVIGILYLQFWNHWSLVETVEDSLTKHIENRISEVYHIRDDVMAIQDRIESGNDNGGMQEQTIIAGEDNHQEENQDDNQTDNQEEGQEADNTSGDNGSGQVVDPGESDADVHPVVYQTVEDDYFDSALFIGDSRTEGLRDYASWPETATFYASTGLTIYQLFDFSEEGTEQPKKKNESTLEEVMDGNVYGTIYIMIGINEMGRGTVESFTEQYRKVLERLRELQPDSVIYLQGILRVSTERSEQGDYINNEGTNERNEALAGLADNRRIFYLDINPEVCDEDGGLIQDYTFDGVHFKAKYYGIWKDYLKTHAIDFAASDIHF